MIYRRYDRIVAILASSCAFLLAALFCFIASCTYNRDTNKVIEYVQQQQTPFLLNEQ